MTQPVAVTPDGTTTLVVRPSTRRPFYVVGHNPNTYDLVRAALDAGANALEPDVNVYENDQGTLCFSHGEGKADAPALGDFLDFIGQMAGKYPQLSLLVFDCKPKVAARAENGTTLLTAIRKMTSTTNLNVILSVPSLTETVFFTSIKDSLQDREGLMIDQENDVGGVCRFFANSGVTQHGYGNGISVANSILGPNVRPSMEVACATRAMRGEPDFIYVWTVNEPNLEREYIRIGVDGIISDQIANLRQIAKESEFRSTVRMAERADNPFSPPNQTYGLAVVTGDVDGAGTDARVTFTITGAKGSASVQVDASLNGRMERGQTNNVTIQGPDLGSLVSCTVQRDNSGNAPGWYIERIDVQSSTYQTSGTALFKGWINTTGPFKVPIGALLPR
jgi:hypothetical protein